MSGERGAERVYVIPDLTNRTFYAVADDQPALWHRCPGAKPATVTRRDLDPRLEGVCINCGRPLLFLSPTIEAQ